MRDRLRPDFITFSDNLTMTEGLGVKVKPQETSILLRKFIHSLTFALGSTCERVHFMRKNCVSATLLFASFFQWPRPHEKSNFRLEKLFAEHHDFYKRPLNNCFPSKIFLQFGKMKIIQNKFRKC